MKSEKSSSSSSSSSLLLRRRVVATVMAVLAVIFLLSITEIYTGHGLVKFGHGLSQKRSSINAHSFTHRKLLNINAGKGHENETSVEPNRIRSDKCSKSDILISQGPTELLPNGIPTYTVEIMNICVSGCNISSIHLTCGWFSTTRHVNPRVFKHVRFNDCLVNDGKSLANGDTLSFQYANTFPYSLTVSSITC